MVLNTDLYGERSIEGWEWLPDRFCTYCGVPGIFFYEDPDLYDPACYDRQHCIHCQGPIAWSIRHCRPRKPSPPTASGRYYERVFLENIKPPLWNHDHSKPIGRITEFEFDDSGLSFEYIKYRGIGDVDE